MGIIFSFTITAAIAAPAKASVAYDILVFETAGGESLVMEISREQEYFGDVPEQILPAITQGVNNPENHTFFQALISKTQKEEVEDALPFCNTQASIPPIQRMLPVCLN